MNFRIRAIYFIPAAVSVQHNFTFSPVSICDDNSNGDDDDDNDDFTSRPFVIPHRLALIIFDIRGIFGLPCIARWIMCQQLIIYLFSRNFVIEIGLAHITKSMCLDFALALICHTFLFEIYLIFYLIQFSRFWNTLPPLTYTTLIYPHSHSFSTTSFCVLFLILI